MAYALSIGDGKKLKLVFMGNLVKTLRLDLLEFKSYSTKYWRW